MKKNIFVTAIIAILTTFTSFICSCTYTESLASVKTNVHLSQPLANIEVTMTNSVGTSFYSVTDINGLASFTLPPGIYSASVSYASDDGYIRHIYNGSRSEIVIGGESSSFVLELTSSTIQINNPILFKELYVGGCQKDDGSGKFFYDKCFILYNNSSEAASLDNVAIGMIEPYNAEANVHSFLVNGNLTYADKDWIPAVNGIWYFPEGSFIMPYSELVVNVSGAIDNTLTYKNSINYANPEYYCMYDIEATSPDGGKYNNTTYYPSPSEVIPTSHYLKAVKYGQANAWPISNTSPAVILFKTKDISIAEFAADTQNIIYPDDRIGNLIYACLKVPREWVLDAVEVFNAEKLADCRKRLTPDLDNGYINLTSGYGHSLIRKIENTVNGHPIYLDTNNSTNDFYEADYCSLR